MKNSGLFKKEAKTKKTKISDVQEKIKEYIENNVDEINSNILLVFYEEKVEKNSLYQIIEKYGNICNFENLKIYDLEKKLQNICNAYGVSIDNKNIRYFIELVGTDMQEDINEIRKLIEYAGNGGTIIKESIDLLTVKKIDAVIFNLTDSLGEKEINKALSVLNNLIYNKEPIQKILITLYNHFKKLYIVCLALKYNKDILQSLELKPNQTFLIGKYKNQSKLFSEQALRTILKELYLLDVNYKKGKIDLYIGLEAILCNYCSN